MRNRPRLSLALALSVAGMLAVGAGTASGRTLEFGFDVKYLAWNPTETTAMDAVSRAADGALTTLAWSQVQHTCAAIEAGTYDWQRLDQAMSAIAADGLEATIEIRSGPACASEPPLADGRLTQPKRAYWGDWARFAGLLAARYGPHGAPGVAHPLRRIEVWSEPNLATWTTGPRGYASAFIRVARAIHAYSDGVKAVVGGLGFCCNPAGFVRDLYRVRGFRRQADIVGAHSYGARPRVSFRGLRAVRERIRGPAKILITEQGWSTCPEPATARPGKCVTRAKQADYLRRFVRLLRDHRRRLGVLGLYWYQIQDKATRDSTASCPEAPKNFFGLYDFDGQPKPAAAVWSRVTGTTLPPSIPPAELAARSCDR